jgi:hypothetical protein
MSMASAAFASSSQARPLGAAATGAALDPESGPAAPLPGTGAEGAALVVAPRPGARPADWPAEGLAATLLGAPLGAPGIGSLERACRPSGTLIVLEQPLAQINIASPNTGRSVRTSSRRIEQWFIANALTLEVTSRYDYVP